MIAIAEIKEENVIVRPAASSGIIARAPKKSRLLSPSAKQSSAVLLNRLAAAIMLQSIEDLWSDSQKEESLRFFRDGRFASCARSAGMNSTEQLELLDIIAGAGRRAE